MRMQEELSNGQPCLDTLWSYVMLSYVGQFVSFQTTYSTRMLTLAASFTPERSRFICHQTEDLEFHRLD